MLLPNSRAMIRIQQIARYRISGRLSDKQIAELVGMTPAGLKHLIEQPDYVELENQLLEGHITKMDLELAGNVEELRNTMRHAVPVAQRALLDAVLQRRDLRTSLLAAKEILDRDPDHTFGKISLNSGSNNNDPALGNHGFNPAAAGEMLVSLQADASKVTMQITGTPTINGQSPNGPVAPRPGNGHVNPTDPRPNSILAEPQPTGHEPTDPNNPTGNPTPPPTQMPLFNIEKGEF